MTRTVSSRRRNQRGVVTLLYTLMMLFIIIPMVGLAIDAGIIYTIKAKLQAAVDGASLAAARSLGPIRKSHFLCDFRGPRQFPDWLDVSQPRA